MAATAVSRSRWQVGPAQCHGLAGDADFLLDLADALAEDRYRRFAEELAAASTCATRCGVDGSLAPDETATIVVPDYGVGLAGVLALLLRLYDGGARMWLPQSLLAQQPAPAPEPAPAHAADPQRKGRDWDADRHRRPAEGVGSRA